MRTAKYRALNAYTVMKRMKKRTIRNTILIVLLEIFIAKGLQEPFCFFFDSWSLS